MPQKLNIRLNILQLYKIEGRKIEQHCLIGFCNILSEKMNSSFFQITQSRNYFGPEYVSVSKCLGCSAAR